MVWEIAGIAALFIVVAALYWPFGRLFAEADKTIVRSPRV